MADDEGNHEDGVQEVIISDIWALAKPQPVGGEDEEEEESSNRRNASTGPKLGKLIQFLNNIEEAEELETKVQELDPATRQSLLQWATLQGHFVLVEWLVKKCRRAAFAFTAGKEITIYEKWIEVRKELEEKAAEAAAAAAAAAAEGGDAAAADGEGEDGEGGAGEPPAEQQVFEALSDLHEELGAHGLGIVKSIGELGVYQGARDAQRAKTGLGRTLFPNGDMYTGEYKLNRREGAGTYIWSEQGVLYCGQWKGNCRHGTGRIVYPDGGRYYGSWVQDCKEGTGRYTYPNGSSYHGQWVQDEKHGEGTYQFADGSAFIGRFEHGEFVAGEWRLCGAKSYFGRFHNDRPIGPGVFVMQAAVKGLKGAGGAGCRIEGEYTAEGVWRPSRTVCGTDTPTVSLIAQGRRVPLLLSAECAAFTTAELSLIANFGPLQEWLTALPASDNKSHLHVASLTLQSAELVGSRVQWVRVRPTLHRPDGTLAASHVVLLQPSTTHLLVVLSSGADDRQLAIVQQTAHAATGGDGVLVQLPEVEPSPTGGYLGAFTEALRRSTLRVAAPTQQNTLPLLTNVVTSSTVAGPATATVRVLLQQVHPEALDTLADRAASSLTDLTAPTLRKYNVVRLQELATLSSDALTVTAALALQRRRKDGALPHATVESMRPPTPQPPAAEPRPDVEELLVLEQQRADANKGGAAGEEE